MTEARLVKVRSALSRQLARPGGRSLADAERLAEAALQSHRGDVWAELGRLVTELEALCAARDSGAEAGVYQMASTVVDLAGFFETGPFYDPAYSLCELTDGARGGGGWSWEAVEVHVRTLRLLHLAGLGAACPDAAALLAGLRQVVASVRPS